MSDSPPLHINNTILSLMNDLTRRGLEAEEIAIEEANSMAEMERDDHIRDRQRVATLRKMQRRRDQQAASEYDATKKLRQVLDEAAKLIRERQTVLRTEGYQLHVFPDRTRYEGEWRNSCIHGQGTLISPDRKEEYDGEFFLGIRNGQGKQTSMSFGTVYTGKFYEGKRHGRGEVVEPEGVFRGDFMDGNVTCLNGEYTYVNGQTYRGGWLNGFYDGYGVFTENSGAKYEGQWSHGRRHGKGTQTNLDGSEVYNGDWDADRCHGKGTMSCPDFTYSGEWKYDNKCGQGTKRFANGSVYEGEFFGGEFHGHGTFCNSYESTNSSFLTTTPVAPNTGKNNNTSLNNAVSLESTANFLGSPSSSVNSPARNNLNASATTTYMMGSISSMTQPFSQHHQQQQHQPQNEGPFHLNSLGPKYSGDWRHGLRHGRGHYSFPAQRIMYDGYWNRGAKHGEGSFTYAGVGVIVGVWNHDALNGDAVLLRLNENFAHPIKLKFLDGKIVSRQDDDQVMLPRVVSLLPNDEEYGVRKHLNDEFKLPPTNLIEQGEDGDNYSRVSSQQQQQVKQKQPEKINKKSVNISKNNNNRGDDHDHDDDDEDDDGGESSASNPNKRARMIAKQQWLQTRQDELEAQSKRVAEAVNSTAEKYFYTATNKTNTSGGSQEKKSSSVQQHQQDQQSKLMAMMMNAQEQEEPQQESKPIPTKKSNNNHLLVPAPPPPRGKAEGKMLVGVTSTTD